MILVCLDVTAVLAGDKPVREGMSPRQLGCKNRI